ncbi:MAG: cation:proton antiporter [Oscillospiraceae bacterium]|nr:cation:proton antiporter [Oscillospiraceae bacterium]
METKIILEVATMLIVALAFGRLVKFIKLPNVTGYLIAGLLLGPSFLNFIPTDMVDGFSVISDIALGFIAFSIGSEFKLSYYKKVGIAPVIIAITESFGAIILVTGVLILFGFDAKLSIMLGAIAAATAPAQTLMVINQYKAKGPLTSMLMSVVAIDDATALIGFGFAATIVKMMSSTGNTNIVISVLQPIYEIVISLVLGFFVCIIMKLLFRWFKKASNRICIIIALILLTYWLAESLKGSALLACMVLGGVLANILEDVDNVIKITDNFTPPIFMLFFVISGAGFEVSALKGIGLIGLIYVIVRVIGKWLGAWIGGKITKQENKICKYLGPTLMPQAGVALGLIVVAGSLVPDFAPQIRVIILCSTFIYSLIGPAAAKFALVKSGEIVIIDKKKAKTQL